MADAKHRHPTLVLCDDGPGVGRAARRAAVEAGQPTRDRPSRRAEGLIEWPGRSEGGEFLGIRELAARFERQAAQTRRNVDSANAVLLVRLHNDDVVVNCTLGYCVTGRWKSNTDESSAAVAAEGSMYRPVFVVTTLYHNRKSMLDVANEARAFVRRYAATTLYVGGHRGLSRDEDGALRALLGSVLCNLSVAEARVWARMQKANDDAMYLQC